MSRERLENGKEFYVKFAEAAKTTRGVPMPRWRELTDEQKETLVEIVERAERVIEGLQLEVHAVVLPSLDAVALSREPREP